MTTTTALKSWFQRWTGAALALTALAGATAAQARGDVFWSVGVQSPGVSMGVANTPPVVVSSGPVYYAPSPVYYAPRPVYHAAPVVVMPPRYGYYDKHYYKHHKHRGHGHHGHRRHDRD